MTGSDWMTAISVRVPQEVRDALEELAGNEGKDWADFLRDALTEKAESLLKAKAGANAVGAKGRTSRRSTPRSTDPSLTLEVVRAVSVLAEIARKLSNSSADDALSALEVLVRIEVAEERIVEALKRKGS